MGETTEIVWCNHTHNIVWGCTKVSEACKFCYAETLSKRVGLQVWGQGADRRIMSDSYWRQPLKWAASARKAGVRRRVFCSSMADVFEDHPTVASQRVRLWPLIAATPELDWLLLTKRPENIARMLPPWRDGGRGDEFEPWPNIWLGTTCENQERANERIPHLLKVPASVRFLSVEPMLGPIDLNDIPCNVAPISGEPCDDYFSALDGLGRGDTQDVDYRGATYPRVDWVITGGESGHGARPMHPAWAR